MKTVTIAALTALLSTGALAVPMVGHGHDHKAPAHGHMHLRNKRDIVWVTETEVETVIVMKTVYDDGVSPPSEPTDAATTTIVANAAVATSVAVAAPAPASPSEAGSSAQAASSPATSTQAPIIATTTSAYVAPAPAPTTAATSAPAVEPTTAAVPTTAPTTAPAASSSAAAATSQASSGSGGASYTGDATYWEPALGACGWTNTADEMVVAISMIQFDPQTPNGNPNNNKLCGKNVSIKCADGSTVSAKVVDRCVGCAIGDLDMTKALFDKVTNKGDGRVSGMQWSWA